MMLEIDAGNTFVKWRCRGGGATGLRGRLPTGRLSEGIPADWPEHVTAVRVASVAGEAVVRQLREYCRIRWGLEPVFARTADRHAGVVNSYRDPARLGVDRWLAMMAAYNTGCGACCVVDCGSAITVDFVAADGRHLGGYIVPGARLMASSLLAGTAEVVADRSIEHFDLSPGTDTASCVYHGISFVLDAIQRELVGRLARDFPGMRLFITGGDGELFRQLAGRGEYVPDLVLDGLEWAF